jgi:cell division protein FtsW
MMSAVSQAIRVNDATPAPRVDPWLVGALIAMLSFSLVMVYSATIASGNQSLATSFQHLMRHAIHVAVGIALIMLVSLTPIGWWERFGKLLLILCMLALAMLLIPGIGIEVNGSVRWLEFSSMRIQPSEFAKVAMVIYAAGYLTRKREALGEFSQGVLVIGIVLAVLALLLLLEPDFGGFVVITLTVGMMLFLAGIRFWHFLLCVLLGVAAMVVLTVISPYRTERVMSFMNPWSDPFDSGFQLVQALIAFGRGEWYGVGLGASIQKLYYLPHADTDFLLAVIAEELGLIGVLFVILLFGVLLWRAFAIARRAERLGEIYAARLSQGIGLLLVIQAMINIGVNTGVLPTKGLTLPFLSYGGSSLLASCIAVGLLIAVHRALQNKPGARR